MPVICSKCGNQNEDGAQFCTNCGSQLNVAVEQPQVEVQAQPQVEVQPQPEVTAQPEVQTEVQVQPQVEVQPQVQPQTQAQPQVNTSYNQGMLTAIKIFMVIACIGVGWLLVPLAWLIPMTIKVFNREKTGVKFSTGFKICTLLFASLIGGILMFCDNNL